MNARFRFELVWSFNADDLQIVILKQTQQLGMRQIYEQLNDSGIDAHKLNASVKFKPTVLCILLNS